MCLGFAGAVAFLPELFFLRTRAMSGGNWLVLTGIVAGGLGLLLALTRLLKPALERLTAR